MADHTITYIGSGAGSGKTYKLVSLIAEQLGRSDITPEQIYAMTFTKKAAEEIRGRVKERFIAGEGGMKPDFEKAAQSSRLNIGTVNSICDTLIRMFSIEAGISPAVQVLEEDASHKLMDTVCGECLPEQIVERLDELDDHFEKEKSFSDFNKTLTWHDYLMAALNSVRAYQIPGFSSEDDDTAAAEIAERNADELIQIVSGGKEIDDSRGKMLELLAAITDDNAERMKSCAAADGPRWQQLSDTIANTIKEITRDTAIETTKWEEPKLAGSVSTAKAIKESGVIEQISAALRVFLQDKKYHEEIREYYALLFRAVHIVSSEFRKRKDALGLIDFTDQEVKLYDLLEQDDVAAALSTRMKVLIIDEFQDTSPIQLALFMRMASLPGMKVFWIGDIKQSIYGFRGSDAELMKRITENDTVFVDEALRNVTSYRSHKGLVDLANRLFMPTFGQDHFSTADIVLGVPDGSETAHPVPDTFFRRWSVTGRPAAEGDALIARHVAHLQREQLTICDKHTKEPRPLRWRDIAVLCRTNKHCASVQAALRARGVPVIATGTGLLETPEAVLLRACLAVLRAPEDTLARAEIITLAESSSPESWLPARIAQCAEFEAGTKASSFWGDDTDDVLKALAEIRKTLHGVSVAELVDAVILRAGIERIVIGWSRDEQRAQVRLANIASFRALASDFTENGKGRNIGDFLLYLDSCAENGTDLLGATSADAVTVCTWHKSKGLEWPFVVLCDMDGDSYDSLYDSVSTFRLSDAPVDIHNPLGGTTLRLWMRLWKGPKIASDLLAAVPGDSSIGGVRDALRKKIDAENRRLLYVGVTRARDYLVNVFAVNSKGEIGSEDSCYRRALAPEVIPLFENEAGEDPLADDSADVQPKNSGMSWAAPSGQHTERAPLRILPSGADPVPVAASVFCTYPNRMERVSAADVRAHGTDYHNAVAYWCANSGRADAFAGTHWSEAVQQSVKSFTACLDEKFPGASVAAEIPVRVPAGGGRYIDARIDMVIETTGGYYIVDHKLTAHTPADLTKFANEYSGELMSYKRALEIAGKKKVLGMLLHLPEDGELVAVQ